MLPFNASTFLLREGQSAPLPMACCSQLINYDYKAYKLEWLRWLKISNQESHWACILHSFVREPNKTFSNRASNWVAAELLLLFYRFLAGIFASVSYDDTKCRHILHMILFHIQLYWLLLPLALLKTDSQIMLRDSYRDFSIHLSQDEYQSSLTYLYISITFQTF